MKVSSTLKVFLAILFSASAFATAILAAPDANAQGANGFVWDAVRTCSNAIVIRWDERNVNKVEFSVTNTSSSWTTGWKEVTDYDSKWHYEVLESQFDKVVVRATFNDGSTLIEDADTGQCYDSSNVPHPSLDETEPGNGNTQPNPITIQGTVTDVSNRPVSGATVCLNNACAITGADGSYSISFEDRGSGHFGVVVTADTYMTVRMSLGLLAETESPYLFDLRVNSDLFENCRNCAYDPEEPVEVCITEDGQQSDVTFRMKDLFDLRLAYLYIDDAEHRVVLALTDQAAETMTLGPCESGQGQPGGGSQTPIPGHDGSFNDPETGNSFTFLSAHRMCEDNSLLVTWTGTNVTDLMFTAYNPSPGWGTDWLQADLSSSVFTADIDRVTAYLVDAGVYFADGSIEMITVSIPDCTPASQFGSSAPIAGIGESNLRVQFNLPDGADISGAPYSLFAPQAAAQVSTTPYLSGFVGLNNTVAVDGLVPGQYRLVVYLGSQGTIDLIVTVGDQPVTNAVVTVHADRTASIAYLAQEQTPAPTAPAGQPTAPGESGSGSPTTSDGVTGLPSTGTGATLATGVGAIAVTALAAMTLTMYISGLSFGIRRKR